MRLIDADALMKCIPSEEYGSRFAVVSAPTIDLSDYSDRLWRNAYEQGKADAEPRKKGEWIDEGQYAEGHSEHAYYCSQCEEHYIGWRGEFNFCPNCGADMRGENE